MPVAREKLNPFVGRSNVGLQQRPHSRQNSFGRFSAAFGYVPSTPSPLNPSSPAPTGSQYACLSPRSVLSSYQSVTYANQAQYTHAPSHSQSSQRLFTPTSNCSFGQLGSAAQVAIGRTPPVSSMNIARTQSDTEAALEELTLRITDATSDYNSTSIAHLGHLFPNYSINLDHSSFLIGHVIQGPWLASCLDPKALKGRSEAEYAHFGMVKAVGPVCGKMRHMVVCGVYQQHLLTYPVQSSGSRGLEAKDAYTRSCLFPVIDESDPDPETSLYYLRSSRGWTPSWGSFIDMSQPYILPLKCPIRFRGALTEHSTRRLKEFSIEYIYEGRMKVPIGPSYTHLLPRHTSGLRSSRMLLAIGNDGHGMSLETSTRDLNGSVGDDEFQRPKKRKLEDAHSRSSSIAA